MKTSQPTPMQHTPLQPPQVITLGLRRFLRSCNGSETVSNETKGSLSINSMGSGLSPTSVWPSLNATQPIYSLSIPGPPSPIASIFFLLMVVISHAKHHPQKNTIPTPLAAKPPAQHCYRCCFNPSRFQQGNSLSFLHVRVPRPSLQAAKLFLLFFSHQR